MCRSFYLVESPILPVVEFAKNLVERLAVELERPRVLSSRVVNYILQTYGLEQDGLGAFLTEGLQALEDYEIDLMLSPLFTPKLADQAIFAELLGRRSIPREQWPVLIDELVGRMTQGRLFDDSGNYIVVLREVTIQRYVDRLRLDGTIREPVAVFIERYPSDRPMLKAIARRAIWEGESRSEILSRYLPAAAERGVLTVTDACQLLDTIETLKPTGLQGLLLWIPRRKQALREQINIGGKQFFHPNIEEMYGGERDQRGADSRLSAKESEFQFLSRLEQTLSDRV